MKIGFLPLYLELYDKVAPDSRKAFELIIKDLTKALSSYARVVSPGIVTTKAEVVRMEKLFKKEKVEAVFTFHLAYSPSYLVSSALARLNKPVFFLDTTMTGTYKGMKADFLMNNHGIHGVMDLSSVLLSLGKGFAVIPGHFKDKSFKENIKKAVQSICTAGSFKSQRIGITGKPFTMMGDFAVNFGSLKKKYGISVVNIDEQRVISEMTGINLKKIKEVERKDRNKYNMKNVPVSAHVEGIRLYLAMKEIVKEEKLDAFTMNFLDYKSLPVPFYAIDRLMEDGLGYAGEGDVLTAALKKLISPFAKGAMFTEFFCPDWKRGLLLMSHMGESDPSFAAKGEKSHIIAKKGFGGGKLTLYHKFKVAPGKLTFVNISKLSGGNFKLVTGLLNVIKDKLYDCLDCPQYSVKPEIPLKDFLEKYSLAGGGHHLYVARGDITREISSAGTALGMQVIKI